MLWEIWEKISNVWAEPQLKMRFLGILRKPTGKKYLLQTTGDYGKRTLRRRAFGGPLSTHPISITPNGEPQTDEIIVGSRNFFHPYSPA